MPNKPKGNLYKRPESPSYWCEFVINGERFRRSTGVASEREARQAAKLIKVEIQRNLVREAERASGKVSLRLEDVALRYYQEVGQHHVNAHNTHRDLLRLVERLGPDTILTNVTGAEVIAMIAWRRSHHAAPHNLPKDKRPEDYPFVTPATVNRTVTQVIKKIINHAKKVWHVRFDSEPDWKSLMLDEPKERVRELIDDERARLAAATRDDYLPFFDFVGSTGQRKFECLDLRWAEVNWQARQIKRKGKDDRTITIPITSHIRAILESQLGNHSIFVFIYVAARDVRQRNAGDTVKRTGHQKAAEYVARRSQEARIAGQRYPLTESGVNSAWKRIRKNAEVRDFRIHDYRHDHGTKLLRQTGNLKLVSRALNHSDLKSTMKYAHVFDEDVAAALETFHAPVLNAAGLPRVPTKSPTPASPTGTKARAVKEK